MTSRGWPGSRVGAGQEFSKEEEQIRWTFAGSEYAPQRGTAGPSVQPSGGQTAVLHEIKQKEEAGARWEAFSHGLCKTGTPIQVCGIKRPPTPRVLLRPRGPEMCYFKHPSEFGFHLISVEMELFSWIFKRSSLYKETVPCCSLRHTFVQTHTHDCIPGLRHTCLCPLSRVLWVKAWSGLIPQCAS